MSYCCITLCKSSGKKNTGGLSFHEIPAAAAVREKWLAAIRRDNWSPNTNSNYTRVCSRHFRPEDFIEGKRRRLKKDAVPSVFAGYPSHSQPKVLGRLLSGDETIRHAPRPSHCSERDHDDIAAEPVRQAALGLAWELGQPVGASPEPACEPGHVTDKSVQVQLLIRHEASQANEEKILSTSATQTEPQAVSSGSLSFASLEQSSSLASVRGRLHSCQQCTYVTLDKSSMNRHLQKHLGERPLQCHLCPAAFTQNSKLVAHVRTHTGERPFSCVHCNASFAMKSHLNEHRRTHTGERPYSCAHCSASFVMKSHLVEHMRIHTGERPFICDHCSASFLQKNHLVRHIRTHTGERPYSCVHCNASFSMKGYLVEHMRTHTGERPFSCVHCNASFSRRSGLMKHIRTHSGERPFSCTHCSASFVMKSYLVEHMRTHTGERPHSCVHCNASFLRKNHLVKHIRMHTGERPFSCAHCNASFTRKHHLMDHIYCRHDKKEP